VHLGDHWEMPDLRAALEHGDATVRVRVGDDGADLRLRSDFSSRERSILLAGGLLAMPRTTSTRSAPV
jgi:hypothetical protein